MRAREDALVDAFIVPRKRARYRSLLSRRSGRQRILDGLNHLTDLEPRYSIELASTTDVVALLRSHGADGPCHLISNDPDLDRKELPLEDAIAAAESAYQGTLVGCVDGFLAYYHGEGGESRVMLVRGS